MQLPPIRLALVGALDRGSDLLVGQAKIEEQIALQSEKEELIYLV